MRYSSRFFLYGPLVGLLILSALVMIHWWAVANALAERLDRANGHEIAPGVRMSFSEKQLAGFPFRMDVMLKNLRFELGDVTGPVGWTTENFVAHALTYGRVQLIFEAAGRQTLSWTDAQGAAHRFTFLPGTFRASAILQNGKLMRFDSEIAGLDGDDFRARDVQLHARGVQDRVDVYLRLQGAHVNGGYAASLGPDISSLVADASLGKAALFEKGLRGEQAFSAALEGWRDNGGKVSIHDIALTQGRQQAMHFAGELSLDDAHDLNGIVAAQNNRALRFEGNHMTLASGLPRP